MDLQPFALGGKGRALALGLAALAALAAPGARAQDDGGTQTHTGAFTFDWNMALGAGGVARYLEPSNVGASRALYASTSSDGSLNLPVPFVSESPARDAGTWSGYLEYPDQGGTFTYTPIMYSYYQFSSINGSYTRAFEGELPPFDTPANGGTYQYPFDGTTLCSLRVIVDQQCSAPSSMIVNAASTGGYWCVAWSTPNSSCVSNSFGGFAQDTSIDDLSNPAVLESSEGYVIAPVPGQTLSGACAGTGSAWSSGQCEEYVGGEVLVQPMSGDTVSYEVELNFPDRSPYDYTGTTTLSTDANGECVGDVLLQLGNINSDSACASPPPPPPTPVNDFENVPTSVTLQEPQSGCGAPSIDGFDGGCPVLTPDVSADIVGNYDTNQYGGAPYWINSIPGVWTADGGTYNTSPSTATNTSTSTRLDFTLPAWSGLVGFYYNFAYNDLYYDPYYYYPHQLAVDLQFPNGDTESILLPPTADPTLGWSPVYQATSGVPDAGPGRGFFPNGTFAVADGGNAANFNAPTGAVSGSISVSNCLQTSDISGATMNLVADQPYDSFGFSSFEYPPYYESLAQESNYGYPPQYVFTGNANAWLSMPLYSGAFHGVGVAGTYSKRLSYQINQNTSGGGDYVNQNIAYDLPGTDELQSELPVVDELPDIGFGKLNILMYVVNGGTRVPISSPQIYNSGTYSLGDGGTTFTGNYTGWSYGSSDQATQQTMHVIVPPGTYNGSQISVVVNGTSLPLPSVGPVTILPVPGGSSACVASCVDINDPTQGWLDDEEPPVVSVDGGSLPPVVDGGYVVHAGSDISISGSAVSSAPVEAVSITATFGDGGTQVFSLSPAADAGISTDGGIEKVTQFVVPVQVACGLNTVDLSLSVTNKCGEFADEDLGTFKIDGADRAPTLADGGAVFVANRTSTFALQGADPDGDSLTYSAISALPLNADGSSATLSPSTGVFTWTPPVPPSQAQQGVNCTLADGGTNAVGQPTPLQFEDSDFCSETGEANVVITVVGDSAPYLSAPVAVTVAEQATATATLVGIDHDSGDTLSYSCTGLPSWATLDPRSGAVSLAPGPTVTGTADSAQFTAQCSVSDGTFTNCAGPQPLVINVTKTGIAPSIAHLDDQTIPEEQTVSLTAQVTDENGDPTVLTLQMTDGDGASHSLGDLGATQSGDTFQWVPTYLQAGVYHLVLTATKNVSDCQAAQGAPSWCASTASVQITVTNVDRPPALAAFPDQTTIEETPLSFTAAGSDPDIPVTGINAQGQSYSDHIVYSGVDYIESQGSSVHAPAAGMPPGMTLDAPAGQIAWTPSLGQWGDYQVVFEVTDDSGLTASATAHIHVKYLNEPPAIAAEPIEQGFEGQWLHWVTGVTDPRGQPDACSMASLPSGASYNTGSNLFTWNVPLGAAASSPYAVTTTCCSEPPDGADPAPPTACSGSDTSIDVLPGVYPPILNPIPLQTVQEGSPLSFTVTATDENPNAQLTFSAASLPPGAAFDAATQVFSWTPDYTQAGSYQVAFTVSDGTLQDSKPGRILVLNTDRPPVIAPIPTVQATVGLPATFTVVVSDPDNDWTSCSLAQAPAGATFDPSDDVGRWTPGPGDVGAAQATVSCCDQPGFPESPPLCTTAPVEFVVSLAPPPGALVLEPEGPFTVYEGNPVGFPVQASETDGGPAVPLSCSVAPLPAGAAFDGIAMQFAWTPDYGQAGSYQVGVTCSDGVNQGSIEVQITVLKQVYDRTGGGIATAGCAQLPGRPDVALLPLLGMLLCWPRRRARRGRGRGRAARTALVALVVGALGCAKTSSEGSLSGALALSDGSALAGATVSISGPAVAQTTSGADGTFRLGSLPAGEYAVLATASDTLEGTQIASAQVQAGKDTTVQLARFTPTGSIQGMATLGAPTGNAGIVVSAAGSAALAVTDDAGNYLLSQVPAGSATVTAVRAGTGSASATVTVSRGQTAQAPDLVLAATAAPGGTAQLSGKVVLTGQPAPQGLPVGLSGPTPSGATTDANGAYSFTGLAAGQYTLTVAVPSAAPAVQSVPVTLAAGDTQTLGDLDFTPLGAISGRALLDGQASSAGIAVSAPGASGIALTDATGAYTLPGVPAGAATVTASYPGRASASASGIAVPWDGTASAPDLTLTAQPAAGQIAGTVSVSSAPDASGVQLALTGPASAAQVTGPNGAFSFGALPDGLYALTASAAGTVEGTQTVSVQVQGGASAPVSLAFTGAGAIAGLVSLNGAPASGAAVFVEGASGAVITGADGSYTLPALAAGQSYSVAASASGYFASPVQAGPVAYGQTVQAPPLVLLPEGASTEVSGAVSVVGLGALPGIAVQASGPQTASALTDADGGFSLEVAPGIYQLSLSFAGDGGSGYAASVPQVVALPGNPGTLFDDGSPWPLPPIELQWGAQKLQSASVVSAQRGGPDGRDVGLLVDADCGAAAMDLYQDCIGTPELVTGGAAVRFPFSDATGGELGLGPPQGAGAQRTLWFLAGYQFDQTTSQDGSPLGTATAVLELGRADGAVAAVATLGLATPCYGECLGNTGFQSPAIAVAGQGLAFTSQESDGVHVLLADATAWPPAVTDLGALNDPDNYESNAGPYFLAPDGKHAWFRNAATGDLVAGPTGPACAPSCTVDIESQIPGGIQESQWLAFSNDGTAATFLDGNSCTVQGSGGSFNPGACSGLWISGADGSAPALLEPAAVWNTQALLDDADGSGQLVATTSYAAAGSLYQQAELARLQTGAQAPVVLASAQSYSDPTVYATQIGARYLVALGDEPSSMTLLTGTPSLTAPLSKVTDTGVDWLVSADGLGILYREGGDGDGAGDVSFAGVGPDGGVVQAALDESGSATQLLGLAVSGNSVYTDTTSGTSPGQPLPEGWLLPSTAWPGSGGAAAYAVLTDGGATLLRVARLDGSALDDVADAGTGWGGQLSTALLSPDGREVAWSVDGDDLSASPVAVAQPLAGVGSAASLGAALELDDVVWLADGRLLAEGWDSNQQADFTFVATVAAAGASRDDLFALSGSAWCPPDGSGVFFDAYDGTTQLDNVYRLASGAPQPELVGYDAQDWWISPDGQRTLVLAGAMGAAPPAGAAAASLLIGARASGPEPLLLLDHALDISGKQAGLRAQRARGQARPRARASPSELVRALANQSGPWFDATSYFALRGGSLAPLDFQDGLYEGTLPW